MDFLDPKRKRAHIIRLYVGYFLVAIAIAFGTLILLFQAYGFDLDRKTGQVIQNGLLYVSSLPDNAAVYLNDKEDRAKTDAKLTIPSGQYTVQLRKDGYRNWSRSVTLDGGRIELLTYPLLVPNELTTKDWHLYGAAPAFATQSLDRRWLVALQPGNKNTFDVFDLTKDGADPTPVTIPGSIVNLAAGDHSYKLVEWASDNRHVLLQHTYSGGVEYLLFDREDAAATVNLSQIAGPNFAITLRDRKADEMFLFDATAQTLQTYTLKNRQTKPLLTLVKDFVSYGGDTVLYQSPNGAEAGKTAFRLWDGSADYFIRTVSVDDGSLAIADLSKYNDDWMVAVGSSREGHVYIYKNPVTEIKRAVAGAVLVPVSILKLTEPTVAAFSGNGQYLMIGSSQSYGVYDTETDRRFYFELKDVSKDTALATWLDDNRLTFTTGGNLHMIDYDGSNQQQLVGSIGTFVPYFSKSYTTLYALAPSTVVPGRFALTETNFRAP